MKSPLVSATGWVAMFCIAAITGIHAATITGTVKNIAGNPIQGVTIKATNGATATTTTSPPGGYTLTVPDGWSGYLVASFKPSTAYIPNSPAYRTITNASGTVASQDFTMQMPVTPAPETLSGTVSASGGGGLANVLVYAAANGGGDITAANGTYNIGILPSAGTPPLKWSGTITPLKSGSTFTPASLTYTNQTVPISGANFTEQSLDTQAPTWPQGSTLTASGTTFSATTLTWTAAQDNIGVTGYKIYRNSEQTPVATVIGALTTTVSSLSPQTTYTFRVEAYDAASNPSTTGPSTQVTTAAVPGGKIAFCRQAAAGSSVWSIWTMDKAGGNQTAVLSSGLQDRMPRISRDGTKIVFDRITSSMPLSGDVYVMNADGTGVTNLTADLSGSAMGARFSWDGSKICFEYNATASDGNAEIYVMDVNGQNKTLVFGGSMTNQGDDSTPAFSPDGQWIVFQKKTGTDTSTICKVKTDGTGFVQLTTGNLDEMPVFVPDGTKILFKRGGAAGVNAEIYRMGSDGGSPQDLTNTSSDIEDSPAVTPEGDLYAFMASSTDLNGMEIYTMNTDGTGRTRLTNNSVADFDPSFSAVPSSDTQAPTWPTGAALTASGTTYTATTLTWPAASDNVGVTGYHIYKNAEATPCATVTSGTSTTVTGLTPGTSYTFKAEAYDAAGNQSNTGPSTAVATTALPTTITDRLVVSRHTEAPSGQGSLGKAKIVLMNMDGSNEVDLTDGTFFDTLPYCNPQGTKIVFARISMSGTTRNSEVMLINVDGSGLTNLTADVADPCNCPHWSWDGTRICYDRSTTPAGGGIDGDLYMMDADGSNKTMVLGGSMSGEGDDSSAFMSPDGRWLVFQRLVSPEPNPRSEIWKVNIATGAATQLSQLTAGADQIDETPSWSPDGQTIVFKRGKDLACDLWALDPAGGNERNVTNKTNEPIGEAHYTFDGQYIFYQTNTGGVDPNTSEVFRMDSNGSNQIQLTNNSLPDWDPAPSPRSGGGSPAISSSLTSLSPSCVSGQNAASAEILLRNTGGGTLNYTLSGNAAWLAATPGSGSCGYEQDVVAITYTTADLTAGDHTANLTITATGATNSPLVIPVSLHVKEIWEDEYTAWKVGAGLPTGKDGAYDDPDGDGQSNVLEMFAKTDPINPASRLHIDSVTVNSIQFTIQFASAMGVVYQVQKSSDLTSGWTDTGAPISGTGGTVTANVALSGGCSKLFVRVRIVR